MSEEVKQKKEEVKQGVLSDLKQRGLEVAEDTLVEAVRSAFRNFVEPVDRLVAHLGEKFPKASPFVVGVWAGAKPLLKVAEDKLLELADKVDGEDDPDY